MNHRMNDSIFTDGMRYFSDEVLPLYADKIAEDPLEGIRIAATDFLSNDSSIQVNGECISWEEALRDMTFEPFVSNKPTYGSMIENMKNAGLLPVTRSDI